jgi:diguanylate cyclase (GGDEF)-like protein
MWNFLKRLVTAPTFPDRELTQAAYWLNFLALTLIALLISDSIGILVGLLDQAALGQILLANTLGLATNLSVLLLIRQGYVKTAAFLTLAVLFVLVTYMNAAIFQSIRTLNILTYFVLIPLTALLLGRRKMNFFAAFCIVTIGITAYYEWAGVLTPSPNTRTIFDDVAVLFMAIAMNTVLLNASIRRVQDKAEELQISETKLQQARSELEQRVEQRTEELSHSNTKLLAEIAERQRAQEQLAYDAVHDALTGLPNRVLFMDRLQHASALAKRHDTYRFAVLFLNLDYFKVVNDSLGHSIGDQLLIALTQRLRTCLHTSDTIARLGGDEFVMLIEETEDVQSVTSKAHRIQAQLKLPFSLDGHQVVASASIGIVADAQAYEQPEEALRNADIAMSHAKGLGKARFEIFSPYMREQALTRLELETDLRHAIERRELELYYQPIVSLPAEQITGFEALLRWHHPTRGLVNPLEFISIAEEIGLIIPIGQWVLQEACGQLREWQAGFPRKLPLTISVNISSSQFCAPDFIEQVADMLQAVGLDGHSLKLEITEGVWLNSSTEVTAIFKKMNDIGIQFHIDDFGTGYSSLSYLQDFPIQAIKIDRSFVERMRDDSNHTEIVRAVIAMAHDLGMETVAEGIETVEQLDNLKQLGCNYGQGYLLSRPINQAAIVQLLNEQRLKPARLPQPPASLKPAGRPLPAPTAAVSTTVETPQDAQVA